MSITSNAYALTPAVAQFAEAKKRLADEIRRNPKQKFEPEIRSTDFAEAALTGETFPANPLQHNETIRAQKQNNMLRSTLLRAADKELKERERVAIAEQSDQALKYLGSELTKLMEGTVKTHRQLGSIRTAQDVLNARNPQATAAWDERERLISAYSEIRDLQRSFSAPRIDVGDRNKIYTIGHVRNSLDLVDHWHRRRQQSVSRAGDLNVRKGVWAYNEWLRSSPQAPFAGITSVFPNQDRQGNPVVAWDYLVWLATEAEPWVPTTSEIESAFEAATIATSTVSEQGLDAMEQARRRYFEIVGASPKSAFSANSTGKAAAAKDPRQSWGQAASQAMFN